MSQTRNGTSQVLQRREREAMLDELKQGLGDKEFVPAGHPLAKRLAVLGLIELAKGKA